MSESRPKAYSYLRFSTPEQAKGDSFRRQTAMALEYAQRHGLDLDESLTFHDLGVSAYRGGNAETGRLGDFLDAVQAGLIAPGSMLLVESLDRISRQAARKALRVIESIVETGVIVVTLNDGRQYTSESLDTDPLSLMLALLTFIRANEESVTKGRRVAAAWSAKRAKATTKVLTARCPAWLHLDMDTRTFGLLPEPAAIVQRIFTETLAGIGTASIARRLNEQGVPLFGAGKMWHRSYVAKIAANPAAAGIFTPHRMEHKDGKKHRVPLDPVPDYYPAVVSVDHFQRVQAARLGTLSPARGRHATAAVSNLLGGLCRCELCGSSMTMVTKSKTWRYLVCTKAKGGAGCVYKSVKYSQVAGTLIENLSDLMAGCPAPAADIENEIGGIEGLLEVRREQAGALVDALVLSPQSLTLREKLAETEAAIDGLLKERGVALDRRIATIGPVVTRRLNDLLSIAQTIPLDSKAMNAALRVVMSAALINPREATITFRWRHGPESVLYYGWPESATAPLGGS